jgi:hypothetical protein
MTLALSDPAQVTSRWLTETLRRAGCLPQGQVAAVDANTTTSFTATIVRLALSYSADAPPGVPTRLILKIARSDPKQRVVTHGHWRKEVRLHTSIVPVMNDPPVAPCFGALFSEETGAAHLLFRDMSDTHYQEERPLPPPKAACESTMDAFAAFHAFWWDHTGLGEVEALRTPASVAEDVDSIRRCYPRFADGLGELLSPRRRRIYDLVLDALPQLLGRLTLGRGLTLIHGDANFSNVLLPRDPETSRALIIDWQLWGVSYPAEDLANLIALHWYGDRREMLERDLLRRYHEGLVGGGVEGHTWQDCWHDYRLAVITRVLFMPMWVWSSGQPATAWWPDLERAMQAFSDLGCADLVTGSL